MARKAKSHRTDVIEVMDDGRTAYEYSDGAWRYDNGQLARRHPKALAPWNSETGTREIEGRHQKVLAAREQAYIKAARQLDGSVASLHGAAAVVTDAQFQLATSPDMGHASTQAAKYLDKTLSLVEESTKQLGDSITVTLTGATVARVLERLASRSSD